MKKSGFTLVELLAVIVILALIALITIPIILNVIEKSKIKTYQRSIDAYGGAVNKAIAEYLLDNENKTSKKLEYNDIKDYIKYEGNKVECETFEIYQDKTVYLAECKVNGNKIDYTYGVYQEEIYAAGLYDENYNLLASWDDLVDRYGLEVSLYRPCPTCSPNGQLNTIKENNTELANGKILIISDNVSTIEAYTFYDSGLTNVVISDSVTDISYYAFHKSKDLSSIKISKNNPKYEDRNSNAIIEKDTNRLIIGLKNTVIPDSVEIIGTGAFVYSDLTNITIPNGVKIIENFAFGYCKNLESITIPSSVTSIKEGSFSQCDNLRSLEFASNSKLIEIENGAFLNNSKLVSIEIPKSVKTIGPQAFAFCKGLRSVTFENNSNLEIVGKWSFEGCSNLENIVLPSSVTMIQTGAFRTCNSLTSVTLNNTVGWNEYDANAYDINYPNNLSNGHSIDVTDPSTNANQLKTVSKTWKRE